MADYVNILRGDAPRAITDFVLNRDQARFNAMVRSVMPNVIDKIEFRSTVFAPYSVSGQELAQLLTEDRAGPTSDTNRFVKPTMIIQSPTFGNVVIAPGGVATPQDYEINKKRLMIYATFGILAVVLFSGSIGYAVGRRSRG